MYFRSLLLCSLAVFALAGTAPAQSITEDVLTAFLKGRAAEKPELEKVGARLEQLEEDIKKFEECSELIKEALSGLKAKIALKAKCGATSVDGFHKERRKLLAQPEKVGAQAAGMGVQRYAELKERITQYLGGYRSFTDAELKAFAAHATALSDAMGIPLAKATASGGGIGDRVGNALAGRMRMFTPDMTWAYVGYLWSILYMSGATMFETAYQPGQWTRWEIANASKPDETLVVERALLSRASDKSEWWRIKTITTTPENADTIILESQFKALDEDGLAMQVVRMRGKLPGDTEGRELMVPQHLAMLSLSAFPVKPTKESVAGATVGTEAIKVGSNSFSAKHVKFGASSGTMEWWLADSAPGTVVKVAFKGQDKEDNWTMLMTGAGTGAKSELGVQ